MAEGTLLILYGNVFDLYIGTASTLYCRRAKDNFNKIWMILLFPCLYIFTSGCDIYVDRIFPSTLPTYYGVGIATCFPLVLL